MSESVQALQAPITPTVLNGLPVSEIRAEMDSILKSRVFVHSNRIRRFLQFVVEECLMGRQHRLKEYLIGLEVFNRQDDFDPRVDSIVRVEARRLRMKIDEYYQKEGLRNEIRIELRKGSYIPIFSHRDSGMREGDSFQLSRRQSLLIAPLTAVDGDTALIPDITRKLTHEIIRGAHFSVLAGANKSGTTPLAESSQGSPKPDYILEGCLERGQDGVQLHLQLKDVDQSAYVWSDSGDPERIQDLAGSLNRSMIGALGGLQKGRSKPHFSDRESFDLYLQGRYQWKSGTPESIRTSSSLFEQALAIDPEYAPAWASLTGSLMISALFGLTDPVEAGPKMRQAAMRAMSIAPALPAAHLAQAFVESGVECNWDAGERSFQRAIQLDPRDTTTRLAYAVQLACRGMARPALMEAQTALSLDPALLATHFILGWLYGNLGRIDEAVAEHTLITRLSPDFSLAYLGLGWANLRSGMITEALAQFTNAANLFKGKSLLTGCLGHCHGRLGHREEALRQLAQDPSALNTAAVYAGLGEKERALSALEQAAQQGDCSLAVQLLNPEFDLLGGENRFTALQERLALGRATPRPMPHLGSTGNVGASAYQL